VACRREVAEELGWDVVPGRLLVVDWAPGRGPWFDQLQFVFDGGVRDPRAAVTLQADELVGVEWLSLEGAKGRLRASAYRRMALAVEAVREGVTVHAEFGRRVQ
jgi:8-oxo-dGTP pyrophosphatase MutT (NUDIX family)